MESRRFIRHPSEIPIEISLHEVGPVQQQLLNNISYGGLSFQVSEPLQVGQQLSFSVPSVRPDLEISAVVAWCHPLDQSYQIGIAFLRDNDSFAMRMVEQICHIEEYRQTMLREQNRHLTSEQAAREWVDRYAKDFPGAEGW